MNFYIRKPRDNFVKQYINSLGAFICLMLVFTIDKNHGDFGRLAKWLVVSLGASALSVFALPQSPMAQPWAVISGNIIPVLVGISCFHLF